MATLLVVDDSAMDRRLVGGILEKNPDWTIIYAVNGKEAFVETEKHIPDLVLTDMQMPEMNGLELVTAIKEEYPLIPVVLMTAQGSEEIAVQALRRGRRQLRPKRRLARIFARRSSACSGRPTSTARNRGSCTASPGRKRPSCIETDATLVPSVVNYIQQAMTRMRFCDDTDCLRVGVALEEACFNSYYHGNLEISSELRETDHGAYYQLSRKRSQEAALLRPQDLCGKPAHARGVPLRHPRRGARLRSGLASRRDRSGQPRAAVRAGTALDSHVHGRSALQRTG